MDESKLDADLQNEAKGVRRCLEGLMEAYNRNDMYSLENSYSKKALMLFPGDIIKKGRTAAAAENRRSLDIAGVDIEGKGWLQYEVDQILILKKEMAVTTIKAATWDPKGIPTSPFKGVGVFKKENGEWFLHIEIFNAA